MHRSLVGFVLMLLLTFLSAAPARAQCSVGWLPGEGVPGVSSGGVFALVVLPDGDVIVGGGFTTAASVAANRIARYNPTTGVWSVLGSGVGAGGSFTSVRALAVLPGGDVIVGGQFTTAGGVAANRIARVNPTTGVWSALGSGTNGDVLSLAVLPGGDVIVGGSFTIAGDIPTDRIARYNLTTGVWSAVGSGTDNSVNALAVLPDGDLIVGGQFTNAGDVPADRIARVNPTTGVWSALGSGTNSIVNALAVLTGGDVIVGGSFTSAGGVAANRVARVNPTTGTWSAVGSGSGSTVRALSVLPDGDVIVSGFFTSSALIARYNPITGVLSALGTGSGIGEAFALAVMPGGGSDVIVGGGFNTATGVATARIARYNLTTGIVSALGSGTNDWVYSLAVLPDGDVMVGGLFTSAGGVGASHIARYNPTTGIWSALGSGTGQRVNALAVLPGGDVIAGGVFFFLVSPNVNARKVARYNPSTGVWSALGSGVNDDVYALAVLQDGDLIVGGQFTTAGGVGRNRIARYNPTTGVWSALGSGINGFGIVYALAVLPGGDLIVAGSFTGAGGLAAPNIARYNPTTGVWSALGSGTNSAISALAVLPDGDVILGGQFTSAGGVAASNIARYNPTTGVWSALGSGTNQLVSALTVLPGGDVIAGGQFTTAGGVVGRNNIARVNPTSGVWSSVQSGANGPVLALALLPGVGDLVAGGGFTQVGDNVSAYFARYVFGNHAPTIGSQPGPASACPNGSAIFSIAADGTGPFAYQWRKGGADINTIDNPTAATAVLNLSNIQAGDVASYSCVVANACGSRTSDAATLAVNLPPAIGTHPQPATACPTDSAMFTVSASGTGPFTYEWRKDTVSIDTGVNPSAATASLTLTDVTAADAASYDCIVANACGSATSDSATLTIGGSNCCLPPTIGTQPLPATACPTDSAMFTVSASGTGPFTYEWRKDTESIDTGVNPSAATASLTLPDVTAADAASYDCIVTNTCGSVTSDAATLTIGGPNCCPTDFNADGILSPDDLDEFITTYFSEPPDNAAADFNSDGIVSPDDLDEFITSYFEGCG